MSLIGILLALAAERAAAQIHWLGQPRLIELLLRKPQELIAWPAYWRSTAAPAVLLVLLAGGVFALDLWLVQPVLSLLFDAGVLFLCLGPRNIAQDIEQLIAARESGDVEAEEKLTRQLLLGPERRSSRRSLIGALFIQSHENLFGTLLWFIALGPAGAVLYRVASRMPRFLRETLPDSDAERSAGFLHAVLAWVPARLCAALYGLAGSLDQSLSKLREQLRWTGGTWQLRTWTLLAEVSAASLMTEEETGTSMPSRLEDCLREVLAMRQRALLILLAAYGIFTAGGIIT